MIETVLGPIEAASLGAASMHEHVLCDARRLLPQRIASEPGRFDAARAAADPMSVPLNLVLDDVELAARELARVREFGQRAIVDLTVWGFGDPDPRLPDVARASGVHIVAGVGVYLPRTRPQWLGRLSVDDLSAVFVRALTDAVPGCSYRAGVIGVVAPGHPVSAQDERLLEAAANAARDTGTALILRVDPRFLDGPSLIERVTAASVPPHRVVLSNVDGYAADGDLGPLRELAATGAVLKWCFGYEAAPRPGLRSATDADRINSLLTLLSEGVQRQVLACGIWTRSGLSAFGGHGYDHLARRIVPALRDRGIGDAAITRMLVEEPRRLLDRS